MDFREALNGAVIMAPMTKGSNLPYRRLCLELGATITMSEMAVARKLRQRRRGELALVRKAPGEPCFGVQLAGSDPSEMAWAAALAESRGADFVDVNLGCPIDAFTRKGLGAALARRPKRVREIVEAMKKAVPRIPVTVKIRLGWNEKELNHLNVARAAVDGGADAIAVHGRTRNARYRQSADWHAIAEVVNAVPIPVIGNGDLLLPHEIDEARRTSGCAAVMVARGALIKPWIFREAREGYRDLTGIDRLRIYERYVALAREHWGDDDYGRARILDFVTWHLGFWCRYVPRREDGSWPSMQSRERLVNPRDPIEAIFARADAIAHEHIARQLVDGVPLTPPPEAPDEADARVETTIAG